MTEQLIEFETAKLAKEKGFDIPGISDYLISGYKCFAPTQSLLQKWLRDKHDIILLIDRHMDKGNLNYFYYPYVQGFFNGITLHSKKTYEHALEQGLIEALKLIKNCKNIILENNTDFFYCQAEIEGKDKCIEQCDHCKEYYKPLTK